MKIAFASTNINKCREIKSVASRFNVSVLSISEIQNACNLPPLGEIAETGTTYHENAFIKAKACIEWCGLPSIGDDSGLEVDILGGAPGIHSARYAGKGATDQDKIRKLLSDIHKAESTGISDRSARFRAVLCYIPDLGSEEIYFEGTLEGRIIDAPRGKNGFGYDPVVDIPEIGGTLAEFDAELVCTRGFRARAAKELFSHITNKPIPNNL